MIVNAKVKSNFNNLYVESGLNHCIVVEVSKMSEMAFYEIGLSHVSIVPECEVSVEACCSCSVAHDQ